MNVNIQIPIAPVPPVPQVAVKSQSLPLHHQQHALLRQFCQTCSYGTLEQVNHLLVNAPIWFDPFENSASALVCACRNNRIDIVKRLLQEKRPFSTHTSGWYYIKPKHAITVAANNGYNEIVRLLLQDGRIDPAVNQCTALARACRHNHINTVILLLADERIDPSSRHNAALDIALKKQNFEIAKLLVQDNRVRSTRDSSYPYDDFWAFYPDQPEVIARFFMYELKKPPIAEILRVALFRVNVEAVRLVLQHNNVCSIPSDLFDLALRQQNLDILSFFLASPHARVYKEKAKSSRLFRQQKKWENWCDVGYKYHYYRYHENLLPTKIKKVAERATVACVGLQDLGLPALVTLEIIDALVPNNIRMAAKWDVIVTVKHFHDKRVKK